ncbi:SDR family oxidoreductase [Exilibacterium tricleocarpae]|uniref:SDR family oxidoreductase n=1 Tax=Exilibacterium tricleocarpae TaxID=2591008 RepID=A0A545TBF0_9GAMM|nr:SDR family oxidoreductase [Exilibacterium tricleocarpae]TQV74550.1 SDR family oxidoreductase [Exilibacterium tricleocarpae]
MNLGLKGLKAIVTGSTSGIGKAIAEQLLQEGADVAVCSRRQKKVTETIEKLGQYDGRVVGSAVDITEQENFKVWVDGVTEQLGGLDIFIANVSPMSNNWEEEVKTDILGTVTGIECAIPYLKASNNGAIVYISSMAGTVGTPMLAAYGASKAAMTHYMKSLALGLVKEGVRVNTVSPGDIIFEGGVWDNLRQNNPDAFSKVLARNPMGRLGEPVEIAKVTAFLASPAASFISGGHLVADGCCTRHVHF